jgi:hypothetical protein
MMREKLDTKANRLLTESRVFVKWSTPENVCAAVRGDGGVHDVHLPGVGPTPSTPTTPTLDELLGPQRPIDYSDEEF